jgi:CBS domain-containing protein
MSQPTWVPVRDVMRKEVTFITGRTDVLEAMRIMKRVRATALRNRSSRRTARPSESMSTRSWPSR